MMGRRQRFNIRVLGRVQGVGYRRWTEQEAIALGCVGWVKNVADGSVEAVVEGPSTAVQELITRMRRGPRGAVVSDVVVAEETPQPAQFSSFLVQR